VLLQDPQIPISYLQKTFVLRDDSCSLSSQHLPTIRASRVDPLTAHPNHLPVNPVPIQDSSQSNNPTTPEAMDCKQTGSSSSNTPTCSSNPLKMQSMGLLTECSHQSTVSLRRPNGARAPCCSWDEMWGATVPLSANHQTHQVSTPEVRHP